MPTNISREKRFDYKGLYLECDGLIINDEEVILPTVPATPATVSPADDEIALDETFSATEVETAINAQAQVVNAIRQVLVDAGFISPSAP